MSTIEFHEYLIFPAACLFTLKGFMISFQRRMETLQHDGIFKIYNSNGSSIKWFRNRKYTDTQMQNSFTSTNLNESAIPFPQVQCCSCVLTVPRWIKMRREIPHLASCDATEEKREEVNFHLHGVRSRNEISGCHSFARITRLFPFVSVRHHIF